MESFSEPEKVWRNAEVIFAAHLGLAAEILAVKSSPFLRVLSELIHSKYSALLRVAKDSKDQHLEIYNWKISLSVSRL